MKIFDEGRSSFLSQSGHEIDDLKDLHRSVVSLIVHLSSEKEMNAYAQFGEKVIHLQENTGQKASNVVPLFRGISSAIKEFESVWNELSAAKLVIAQGMYGRLKTSDCLGSKRGKALDKYVGQAVPAKAHFLEILEETYTDLPEKQMGNLLQEYWSVLKNFLYGFRSQKGVDYDMEEPFTDIIDLE